eukprot:g2855.t1
MGEHDSLTDLLRLVGTMWIAWSGGILFSCVHSALIGEIFAGAIAGPDALGLIGADDLRVVGNLGLSLLVLEGGLSVEISTIQNVGVKAFVIALTGTLLPLFSGWATLRILGFDSTSSFSGGTCLSSTSIGIATKLLQSSNELTSPLGNLISVTAITDDVLSLLILAVLTHVTHEEEDEEGNADFAMAIARPLLASFGIGCVGFFVAIFSVPQYVVTTVVSNSSIGPYVADTYLLFALVLATAMAAAAGYSGSTFLLGIFLAGVGFAPIKEAHASWNKKCSVVASWLSTVFFVSVGATIPLSALLSGSAILKGLLLTVFAVLSKHVAGAYLLCGGISRDRRDRLNDWNVVGWALVGRGELGLVIGQTARDHGLLDDEAFAIVVFSIIASTLLSPIVFTVYLRRRRVASTSRGTALRTDDSTSANVDSPPRSYDSTPLTAIDACRLTHDDVKGEIGSKTSGGDNSVVFCDDDEGGVEMMGCVELEDISGWSLCQSFTWVGDGEESSRRHSTSNSSCTLVVDAEEWHPTPFRPSPGSDTNQTATCGQVHWSPTPCKSDADCSYNGRCADANHDDTDGIIAAKSHDTIQSLPKYCSCRPAWKGDRCQTLSLLPTTRNAGLRQVSANSGENVSTWGGAVLLDDDNVTLHMWAAEMLNHCGIDSWTTNSQIVHASCVLSTSSLYPSNTCKFRRDQVVWGAFAHEPNVVRGPQGEFVMYFTASENVSKPPSNICDECKNGRSSPSCHGSDAGSGPTYMSWSASPLGPWSTPVRLFEAQRGDTDMDTNLAVVILPNGTVVGIGRTGGDPTGIVAHYVYATNWKDPSSYVGDWGRMLFPDTHVLNSAGVEDPFVYQDSNQIFHAVFHNQLQNDDEKLCGGHAYSVDGRANSWVFTGTAWGNRISWEPGNGGRYEEEPHYDFSRRERPHFVFGDPKAPFKITALTTGVQYGLGSPVARGGEDACYTAMQPVKAT